MPAGFENCVAKGGRVRTKRVDKTHYMHICFLGGKSFAGEVKAYKKVLKGGKSGKK